MYRIILTANGIYKKTLYRIKTRRSVFIRYNKIKDENSKVMFPREHVNSYGIFRVNYKIYVVKDTEEGDEFRILKDKLGRTYVEEPLYDLWTVLDSSDYNIEETFSFYGRNPLTDRVTIHDILKPLMENVHDKNMTKQVIVAHNKLVIYNESQFDMVICKCKKDAQRLHHALAKACRNNNIKNIIFMGTASKATLPRIYKIIYENTDWSMIKIRRTSTNY